MIQQLICKELQIEFFYQASPYSWITHLFWKLFYANYPCAASELNGVPFCSHFFFVVQALYKALTPFYIVRLIQTTGSYRTTQELA